MEKIKKTKEGRSLRNNLFSFKLKSISGHCSEMLLYEKYRFIIDNLLQVPTDGLHQWPSQPWSKDHPPRQN